MEYKNEHQTNCNELETLINDLCLDCIDMNDPEIRELVITASKDGFDAFIDELINIIDKKIISTI